MLRTHARHSLTSTGLGIWCCVAKLCVHHQWLKSLDKCPAIGINLASPECSSLIIAVHGWSVVSFRTHTHRECDLGLRSICWICCIWRDSNARQSFQLLLIIAMGRQMSLVQGTHTQYKGSQRCCGMQHCCTRLATETGRVASGNGRIATCCTFSACLAYFATISRLLLSLHPRATI